jgi:hypothetical protein
MNGFNRIFVYSPLVVGLCVGVVALSGTAMAQDASEDDAMNAKLEGKVVAAPTAAEAEAAFQAAREGFLTVATGSPDVTVSGSEVVKDIAEDHVPGGAPQNISLEQINVVLDVDNASLRDVMAKIVQQAANYTGPWTVKWRLSPENASLLDEKVNLTAEANFGDFCSLLTERVKNMTGIQLHVTAFAATRVLLVADTYY